ncbi:IS66 family transposase, partial [Nocardiopsis rhodophaea]
ARAAEIMADVMGAPVSTGWLAGAAGRAYALLTLFEEVVRAAVAVAYVVCADETPTRVAGQRRYVHVACTDRLTCLHPGKRSKEAIEAGGVLPGFAGVLVTDAYAAYDSYGGGRQLCCAHLLRELQQLIDFDPVHAPWAANMAEVLTEANGLVRQARGRGRAALEPEVLEGIARRYRRVVVFAKSVGGHALIRRLDARQDDYLRFAADFGVPFTSNAAERDLRMVKLHDKVSGTWRSWEGLVHFCRIRSYTATLKKNGVNVL